MTPEKIEKMQMLYKLADKRARTLGLKAIGMILVVASGTLLINFFVQSPAFIFLANLSGGFLVLLNTQINMKHEVAALEKQVDEILGVGK